MTGEHDPKDAAQTGQPLCHGARDVGLHLELLRDRDAVATEKLFDAASAAVVMAVRRFAEDDEDAQELAQGAWHRILKKLPRLAHDGNPVGWCVIVARNHCKSILRRRAAEPELMNLEQVGEVAAETPHDPIGRRAAMRAVRASVAALSESERRAVTLRLLQELTWAETAGELGVPIPVARALVRQGLRVLQGDQSLVEAYAALVGKPASQVQDDLETFPPRQPILAFLRSAAHRHEARSAIESRADVFGTVVFANDRGDFEKLLRTHRESPVLVDLDTSLARVGERDSLGSAVRWDRAYADKDVFLSALAQAIVAKPVTSLVDGLEGRADPRACEIMSVILDHACAPYGVVALADDLHTTARTLGRRCISMHIPSPKTLISLGRVFVTESMIDWSGRPAQAVADVFRFSDASSYRRLVKNVLGMSSSSIRDRGGGTYVATVIAETLRTDAWDATVN